MKRRTRSRRARRRGGAGLEWIGGLLTAPFVVTDRDEPYYPALIVWMEMPDRLVVGHEVVAPEATAGAVGRTLLTAMEEPLVGAPRRPARIRLADASLTQEVRKAVGDGILIEVAPTPELDELLEIMSSEMSRGEEEASYLEGGRVSPEAVAGLFSAARLLYTMKPWEVADDDQVLRMDIPALGVDGACVSIIGALGEKLGFLIFPALEGYEAFWKAAAAAEHREHPEYPEQARGAMDLATDLGTGWLALCFERGTDLPASIRREVAKYGWPIANAEAYPTVERWERDGAVRPLVDRDVEIATACATSLCTFFVKHRRLFEADDFEPVCESYFDENDLEVRFTLPYEAFPEFKIEADPAAHAPAPATERERAKVGRNDPCPCGSGRKYKKCHLPLDREEHFTRRECDSLHELDASLVRRLTEFAVARFGLAARGFTKDFTDAALVVQFSAPWSVYHYRIEGATVLDHYLEDQGRRLSRAERAWFTTQQAAWLSVWEVTEVDPGKTVTLHDLLSGETRSVHEESGSRTLVVRDALLARVADHDGFSLLCGVHPRPLPPFEAAEVVRRARGRLRRKRAVPVERLRAEPFGRYLIRRWEEAVEELDAAHKTPPTLVNTDGDPLLLTTDHFEVVAGARSEVEARLAALEGAEPQEAGEDRAVYVFLRPGNAQHADWDNTVVGHARLSDTALQLETNSRVRADALRERVENACGDLIRHRAREHTDPLSAKAAPAERDPAPGPTGPEVEQLLLKFKQRHYADWADQPLPALDGKTPREAVRTAQGKAAVDVLLKDMENREQRSAGGAAFDFSVLRRELRLE
ncbi:MAG: SEC-C domain-containing protein [Acidobacteria bacterium]|nr:SEC-C domain-containing protein [Acidobacteriota bacterium]